MRSQTLPGHSRTAGPTELPAPWFYNPTTLQRCAVGNHQLDVDDRVQYVFGRRAKDMQLQCWVHRNDEVRDSGAPEEAPPVKRRGRRKPSSDEVA